GRFPGFADLALGALGRRPLHDLALSFCVLGGHLRRRLSRSALGSILRPLVSEPLGFRTALARFLRGLFNLSQPLGPFCPALLGRPLCLDLCRLLGRLGLRGLARLLRRLGLGTAPGFFGLLGSLGRRAVLLCLLGFGRFARRLGLARLLYCLGLGTAP